MELVNSNEITVKIKCELNELYKILKKKEYKIVDKFFLDDIYFISKDIDITNISTREILSKAILVRKITREDRIVNVIVLKKKEFNEEGDIISQAKVECDVLEIEDAKKLLIAMNYIDIMNIKESNLTFKKDDIEFSVKNIINGDNLIEMDFNSWDELKNKLNKLEIPIYTDNYFIKKAEIELDKILKRN